MIKFHQNVLDWDTERAEMLKEEGVAPSRDSQVREYSERDGFLRGVLVDPFRIR